MANLAATYRNQGRWREAEELERTGYGEEFEGAESGASRHTDQHGELGDDVQESGTTEEAEVLDVQIMETRKRVQHCRRRRSGHLEVVERLLSVKVDLNAAPA